MGEVEPRITLQLKLGGRLSKRKQDMHLRFILRRRLQPDPLGI